MFEMGGFRPELHVAQQSRRDKLRIQQAPVPPAEAANQVIDTSGNRPPNSDAGQNRSNPHGDLSNNFASMLSASMLNFVPNPHHLQNQRGMELHHPPPMDDPGRRHEAVALPCLDPVPPCLNHATKTHGSNYWGLSCFSGPESSFPAQNPTDCQNSRLFKETDLSSSRDNENQTVPPPLHNTGNLLLFQDNQKQYGQICFNSGIFPNTLQDVVACAGMGNQQFHMPPNVHENHGEDIRGGWGVDDCQRLSFRPRCVTDAEAVESNDLGMWFTKPFEGYHTWSNEEGYAQSKCEGNILRGDASAAQRLSLSLSTHQPSDLNARFVEHLEPELLHWRAELQRPVQDSKNSDQPSYNHSYSNPFPRYSVSSHNCPAVSSMNVRASTGPLGPFTGYAAILKSSKFLNAARQLLDEFCAIAGPGLLSACSNGASGQACREIREPYELRVPENDRHGIVGTTARKNVTFHSSDEVRHDGDGSDGEYQRSLLPELTGKKAKLLLLQEEVCRKYKQYHQQMQMVISSFESVAGLSAATPYASLALKSVSKHFRCLMAAISELGRHINKAPGGELLPSGTRNGDTFSLNFRHAQQNSQKQKPGGNVAFLQHQQPVWRPQRGLPERAVAVLRAWLFEHFLHPYPTDTDKHMLAAQTGLSRNQVSNWFINARVRVWKPMVEEIHMLETKGSTEMEFSPSNNDGKSTTSNENVPNMDQIRPMSETTLADNAPGSSDAGRLSTEEYSNFEDWQIHRSRVEEAQKVSVPEGVMGYLTCQNEVDMVTPNAVSLTLGLRHGADGASQPHEIRHFTSQLIHDFVG